MRRKILLISLLTSAVLGVGVVYVNKIMTEKSIARWSYDEYLIDGTKGVSSNVDIAGVSKGKRKKQTSNNTVDASTMVSNETSKDALSLSFSGTSSRSSRTVGSYGFSRRNENGSTSSGSSGILYAGRAGGGSSSSSNSGVVSGGGMGASIGGGYSQPFSVPTTSSNIVLVDPSTDPLKENQIPVGNGVWFMLLMVATYGAVRFRK